MTVKTPPTPPEPPFSVREPFLIGVEGVTRVTFCRHAQQAYPVSDEFVHDDWADPPLSQLGEVQAHALAAALGEEDVDVVICSSMKRARRTAEMVASPHGLEPIVIPELREIDSYRDLEPGTSPQSLVDPAEWKRREDLFRVERKWDHMFFGEPSAEFRARCLGAIDKVLAEFEGKNIVFISHGGVINAFFANVIGCDEDFFFLPNHASMSTAVVKGDVRRIKSINERHHLHAGILTD
ncbi:MAG: histidine phosphatase family protein [Candidatus Nanopelagicales bacterium]